MLGAFSFGAEVRACIFSIIHHACLTREFDAEDEIFAGRITGIRDVVGFHADNVTDLKEVFRQAVDDYVDACARSGKAALAE